MKKHIICLVGLIAILVSTQVALTTSDLSSYDLMADFNRDRIVDAEDLARLCNAYGSRLVLPSEPNKTVVTVLSFDKDPPEVENARVAIVDPNTLDNQVNNPINVKHANSSGIATFELDSSKNYTAIAWSGSAYNYNNFTTNSLGEASVLILLGEPSLPPIRALLQGWVVVTVLENETGTIVSPGIDFALLIYRIEFCGDSFVSEYDYHVFNKGGIVVIPPNLLFSKPYSRWGLVLMDQTGVIWKGCSVYSPDEEGCANVILYVTPP